MDPGLDGDVHADEPYLYGNALSSINLLRVGEKTAKGEGKEWEIPVGVHEDEIKEGGEGDGQTIRKDLEVPEGADARKKWFLREDKKEKWMWEEGRVYQADFFNPYLDFNGATSAAS